MKRVVAESIPLENDLMKISNQSGLMIVEKEHGRIKVWLTKANLGL